jgi:uncharacterized cupin superfamily protein
VILEPGVAIAALAIELQHEAVPPDRIVAGSPTTGSVVLATIGEQEIGVWEMTVGTASDVEEDEVFVVLAGAATVRFDDDGAVLRLVPGSVGRLAAGQRTVWTVTETLRKVYLA